MNNIVFDIETNKEWDQIWVVVTRRDDTGELQCHRNPESLTDLLKLDATWTGHNVIGFDAHYLRKLWKITIPQERLIDTLVMSRLWNPELENGHSLAAWGERLKFPKSEWNDFSQWSQELEDRCVIDVDLTVKVYDFLKVKLAGQEQALKLEQETARILSEQERTGWLFDLKQAHKFHNRLLNEIMDIEEEMQRLVPPTILKMKTKEKSIPFNPGSRKQIAKVLMSQGWNPKLKTEAGTIVVNEETLDACFKHYQLPLAKTFSHYLLLQKRASQVHSWIEAVQDDGRIHGRVNPCGAISSRMTHYSPNVAQSPRVTSPYGGECRELWIAPDFLVGIDASGIELRMLAHYMNDEAFSHAVVSGSSKDGTDVHTRNMKALGITDRDIAKTFIYAFLYGAGREKIAKILNCSVKEAAKRVDQFLTETPKLRNLRIKVAAAAERGWLKGLDGRQLRIRSPHTALNTLLQGGAAIVMKQALIFLDAKLKEAFPSARFVGNIHDEWQIECSEVDAEWVGKLGKLCIQDAGEHFNLNLPLAGEYTVGKSWKDTH